jgi:hypothetical protein
MRNIVFIIAGLAPAIVSGLSGTAMAQQPQVEGSVSITPFEARGITTSTIYTVDSAFADEHGVEVPAPFSLAAPRRESQNVFAQAKPPGGGPIKIYFTTDDADRRIFSSLQIVTYTVKSDDPQKRLEVGQHLAMQVLKKLGATEDTRVNVTRNVTIGGMPAVEIVGNFENQDGDRLLTRLVALAKPETQHGIIGIAVGHPRQGLIKAVEDIYETSASLALETVVFR